MAIDNIQNNNRPPQPGVRGAYPWAGIKLERWAYAAWYGREVLVKLPNS